MKLHTSNLYLGIDYPNEVLEYLDFVTEPIMHMCWTAINRKFLDDVAHWIIDAKSLNDTFNLKGIGLKSRASYSKVKGLPVCAYHQLHSFTHYEPNEYSVNLLDNYSAPLISIVKQITNSILQMDSYMCISMDARVCETYAGSSLHHLKESYSDLGVLKWEECDGDECLYPTATWDLEKMGVLFQ
jgi:hypothetical protein